MEYDVEIRKPWSLGEGGGGGGEGGKLQVIAVGVGEPVFRTYHIHIPGLEKRSHLYT